MNRTHIILTSACVMASALILVALYAFSPLSKELTPSSFDRKFQHHDLTPEHETTVKFEKSGYYIAGATHNTLWLANPRKPFSLTKVNLLDGVSEEISISLIGIDSILSPKSFRTIVDSPYFYLANGIMPIIFRGNIYHWNAEILAPSKNYYFVDALPITPSKILLRSYSDYQQGIQIGLLNSIDTPHFKFNFDLLQKQREGVFSVQGSMHYSKTLKRPIYIYTYRNQYIVSDTTLTNIYTGNTIDTFKTAPIRIRSTDNNGTSMLASPPFIINGKSCVFDKYLYIQSNLLARNEDREEFLKSSTIDVYNVDSRTYINSIHVPTYKNKEISDYKIINENLYALYDNHIIKYKLNKLE